MDKIVAVAVLLVMIFLTYQKVWSYLAVFENQQCAGFIGTKCPSGYLCKIPHPYPDASGSCKFLGF